MLKVNRISFRPVPHLLLTLALALSAPMVRAAEVPEVTPSAKAWALRVADLAQSALRSAPVPTDAHYRQAAALLEAAHMADPTETRYLRLLTDARLQLRDYDGALRTLMKLRTLDPADKQAQIQFIQITADQKQIVGEKVKYLEHIVSLSVVSPEVRSFAAWLCYGLLDEQKRVQESLQMLDKAIALNPTNMLALVARHRIIQQMNDPQKLMASRLAIIRANPVQPDLLADVARELATAGLVAESIEWYRHAIRATVKLGQEVDLGLALEMVSQLYLNDQLAPAQGLLEQIITRSPEHYAALVFRSIIERRSGQAAVADKFRVQARNSLINQLETVRGKLAAKAPATRPVNQGALALPDLAGDADLYKKSEDKQLKSDYLDALEFLAWFDTYFNEQPGETEKSLAMLTALADPTDKESTAFIARITGWLYLKQNRKQEAEVKLKAVAATDTYAKLGLVKLMPPDEAKAEAAKLLASEPRGLMGALIYDAVRDMGVKVAPAPHGAALNKIVQDQVPLHWLSLIDSPHGVYTLRLNPLRIVHRYGEPILATLTITNRSPLPISIGDTRSGSVLNQQVFLDVQLGGLFREAFFPTAVESFTREIVIPAGESMEKVVRIDQGNLHAFVSGVPTQPIVITAYARTNPIGNSVGAAGQHVESVRLIERAAFIMGDIPQVINVAAAGKNPAERVRALEFIGLLARLLMADANPDVKKNADQLMQTIRGARADEDPYIRSWASRLDTLLSGEAERGSSIQRMMTDKHWQVRLCAMMSMSQLPLDRQTATAKELADNAKEETVVRELAKATGDVLNLPPPKPPTTAPATQPAK